MPPLAPFRIDGDPIRVGIVDILMRRVRIGAGYYDHVECAAAGDELAEGIRVAHPGAAIVQADLGGVIGHAAAGAQAGRIGVDAFEIIEPELRIVSRGIILYQRELCPAHRAIEPPGFRLKCSGTARSEPAERRKPRHLEKRASGKIACTHSSILRKCGQQHFD